MNTKLTKFISIIIALFLLIYVGYQIYLFIYNPYRTETVFETTISQDINSKGLVVRDESIISHSYDGVLSYVYENGTKVAKDNIICDVYDSVEQINNTYKLSQIQAEIDAINEASDKTKLASGQPDLILNEMISKQREILDFVEDKPLKELSHLKYQLMTLTLKRQMIIDSSVDVTARLNELNDEKNTLLAKTNQKRDIIKSPAAGFFTDSIDGLEGEIDTANIKKISVDNLEKLIKQKPNEKNKSSIGKIITSYDWKYATVLEGKSIEKLKVGQNVNLIVSSLSNSEINATVEKINYVKADGKGVVVFTSNFMSSDISRMRIVSAQIRINKNTGLKVPKQAIRYLNNKKGVYIMLGTEVLFKEIDINYEEQKFVLSKIRDDNESEKKKYLQNYDDIIVEGKDLYDRKSIK